MEQLKIGDFTLTWLDGGVTHLDGGAMFGVVPKPLWAKKYPENEKNQIELRTDPILISGRGENIVIEGGIGNNRLTDKQRRNYGVTQESNIEASLSRIGMTTADVDKVIATHMHFDHVLGLTKQMDQGRGPTFEKADIWTSEIEWEEMKEPNIRSKNTYWKQNWESIEERVQTFKTSQEIAPGITMIHTGGHSDGHSIVMIESGDEKAIHMADIMPTHAHFNPLWVLAFDDYPMTSIEAKQKWLKHGLENDVWFTFYHDAYYRAVKMDERGAILKSIERKG